MVFSPRLGSWLTTRGACFRVWAPEANRLDVVLESSSGEPRVVSLSKSEDGMFSGDVEGVKPGQLYRYRVDGNGPYPDPASRTQPQGVHGPSQVIDPSRFSWTDRDWKGIPLEKLVFYELHIGTFTAEGTFKSAMERLPYLKDLGVTAVELMPVADFPGERNWGYDGVSLFAPARCYGDPNDLRALVDKAHGLGLAVFLDVVYNHFGPDGNYLRAFSPYYFNPAHKTPWGDSNNFDGSFCRPAREFFIENAMHWIHEYHFDGLRLDATHAIVDESDRHFLADLSETVRVSASDRRIHLVAEDHRNLAIMTEPIKKGGYGLDAVWADDLHHSIRRFLAGDSEGYYQDYAGTVEEIAETMRKGWFFTGQYSSFLEEARGTDPAGRDPSRFVVCLQNHDQIGNRACGERLHHQIDAASFRAATALFLLSPETPLLFMGQEWGASTPFLYFTDHNPELGQLVTKGRREEFKRFSTFSDPTNREKIPDPQSVQTFSSSRINWTERDREPHAGHIRLHQKLLKLRQENAATTGGWEGFQVQTWSDQGLIFARRGIPGFLAVINLKGSGSVSIPIMDSINGNNKESIDFVPSAAQFLTTEDAEFCSDPHPIVQTQKGDKIDISFQRPGAFILSV